MEKINTNKGMKKKLILLTTSLSLAVCLCAGSTSAAVAQDTLTTQEKLDLLYGREAQLHQCAEIMRQLGYDDGTTVQQLGFRQLGTDFHECQVQIDELEEQKAAEEAEAARQAASKKSSMTYLGEYQLTAYTWTGNRMANGQYPYVGACACNSIPLGTTIYIEGYGTYVVCDRGGMGSNVVDIYMDTESECVQFGRKYGAQVYKVN